MTATSEEVTARAAAATIEFGGTPWALRREYVSAFSRCLLSGNLGGIGGISKRAASGTSKATVANSVAVLPLYGVITQRSSPLSEMLGSGTTVEGFKAALRDLVSDEGVKGIVIDIDSPGGSVYGVAELAEELYLAGARKPIVSVANSLAASAAYWVGAAASRFLITPGGEAGSIGVWSAHEDWSKNLDESGVKTTLVSAGKYKTEGNPYGPLGNDARAFMQSRVNDYYGMFTKFVAKARGKPVAQVRDGMGQGRILGATDAVKSGLVDAIGDLGAAIQAVRTTKTGHQYSALRRELEMRALC